MSVDTAFYLGIAIETGERRIRIRAILVAQINDRIVYILSHGPACTQLGLLLANQGADGGICIFEMPCISYAYQ